MRVLIGFWVVFVLLCLFSYTADADIYRKIENGQVIFSDTPFDGAEKIELGPINTISGMDKSSTELDKSGSSADHGFKIKIASPVDGRTYQHDKDIAVSYRVESSVPPEDKVVLMLDGQEHGSAVLSGLDRGAHVLEVRILDASGHKIASAAAHFLIYQHSLFQPHS